MILEGVYLVGFALFFIDGLIHSQKYQGRMLSEGPDIINSFWSAVVWPFLVIFLLAWGLTTRYKLGSRINKKEISDD